MRVSCPYLDCGVSVNVPDGAAGEVLSCPACDRKFRTPGLAKSPSSLRRPGLDPYPATSAKNKTWTLLVVPIVLVLIIGGLIFYSRSKREEYPPEEKARPAEKEETGTAAKPIEGAEPSEPSVSATEISKPATPAKKRSSPRLLWTCATESEFTEASLVFADGVLLATSPWDGVVYAVDAKTGQPKWIYDIGAEVWGTLAAGEGRAFVGAYDRRMYAFDIATGNVLWKSQPILVVGRMAGVSHSPELTEDTLYFVAGDRLIAAGPANGEEMWSWQIAKGEFNCGPVAAGDYLLLVHGVGLTAFDKETQSPKWTITKKQVDDCIMYYRPVVSGRNLYFQVGEYIFAFDLETGNKVWECNGPGMDFFGPFYIRLVLHQGVLYAAGSKGNYLYAIDAESGELKWKKKFPSMVVATPAAYGSSLFVAVGKTLYAIDIKTQEVYWKQDLESEARYGLLIADGKLFVATKGGKIFAFEL